MQRSDPVPELLALFRSGRVAEMEHLARSALQWLPEAPLVHELLGIALTAQARDGEALVHLERASALKPDDAQFLENLGLCQRKLGQFNEAERSLRRSLDVRPGSVETINALGSVLRSLERIAEAREQFERALSLNPGHAGARFNLAKVLRSQGDWPAAAATCREVLAIDPANIEATVALAEILHEPLGQIQQARGMAERALELLKSRARKSIDELPFLDSLANVFGGVGEPARALELLRLGLEIKAEPSRALRASFLARVLCEWDLADALEPIALRLGDPEDTGPAMVPWCMIAVPKARPVEQLVAARKFAKPLADRAHPLPPRASVAQKRDRIRVGYLCAHFNDHPTGHLLAGFFEHHDHDAFETFGYDASHLGPDDYRDRMERAFDAMVRISSLSNEAAASRIREDDIDILIDLDGWISGNRAPVAAMRPAPVQMQWIGFPGTLGAPWIDYIVADPMLIPEADEQFYQEKIIRLPDTYQPNDERWPVGEIKSRAAYGLPEDAIVLCSFNASYKITRDVFEAWLDLLDGVERSVLWILEPPAQATHNLRAAAERRGVSPGRLIFAPRLKAMEHRARIRHADIALDCFPCGSHTTGSDALHAGVPLVALKGDTFASRVSSSLLAAAGLPDLITNSLDEYRGKVLYLANNPNTLARIRARVEAARHSALFDAARFARNFEKALISAWERYVSGLPPASFSISD
ncbi:MAG TPA: tetratricopeptide repeat protein [Pseudorhodoplanes sp.]|nr:tetratricopeptide repeat protein [Pseudorhodoplanes sp.]